METKDGFLTFYAESRQVWREWLAQHHKEAKNVWLIIYKKNSGTPSVSYDEAVDEALCFGWIDSKINKRDENSFFQFFAKRNPKSNWSKVNKQKVAKLEQQGLITTTGWESIEFAKKTGTWTALDDVENLIVPPDLQIELDKYPHAAQNFANFSPSSRRGILEWIFNAKQTDTRQKRIAETAKLANNNEKANQYQAKK